MQQAIPTYEQNDLVKRTSNNLLVFNAKIIEIAILDRRGKVLWHQRRLDNQGPIQWNGLDTLGQAVEVGQYTCRIHYRPHEVVYLPFVFMK